MRNTTWLLRSYYSETLKVYARVWDIYIKFYTVFLTANVIGLGLVVQHVPVHRAPICWAFICQNIVTLVTSLSVGIYSRKTDESLVSLTDYLVRIDNEAAEQKGQRVHDNSFIHTLRSPVAGRLSMWAGVGNCVATVCTIVCWIAVLHLPPSPTEVKCDSNSTSVTSPKPK
jgi:hypothetical protein